MSSYDALVGYGTDEFHVSSDDLDGFAGDFTTDYLRETSVSKIRDRELRMMNKVNQYMPTHDYNKHQNNIDYCRNYPDMYSSKGVYDQQKRQSRRENIEQHYFSGREIRERADPQHHKPPQQHKPPRRTNDDSKKEGFNTGYHQEIMELQQKNDMLVFFIFILAIVVIIQFSKRQTPKYVHVFPIGQQTNQTDPIQPNPNQTDPIQPEPNQPESNNTDTPAGII